MFLGKFYFVEQNFVMFLSSPGLLPAGGRCSHMLAEYPRKVRLIGKAGFDGDIGQRLVFRGQQLLGAREAGIHLPLMRRHAG